MDKRLEIALNNKTYLLLCPSKKDDAYLRKFANKFGIEITDKLPWKCCIDTHNIGLSLMCMICFYEITCIKTETRYRALSSLKKFKNFIKDYEKINDYEFLKEDGSYFYYEYISCLNKEKLQEEMDIVGSILAEEKHIFLKEKEKLSTEITKLTKHLYFDSSMSDLEYFKKIRINLCNLIFEIERAFVDLHKVKPISNIAYHHRSVDEYLKVKYNEFHNPNNPNYSLKCFHNNLKNIFNVFNIKTTPSFKEISLDRYKESLSKYFGPKINIPDNCVGKKIGDSYDYRSILEKLLLTLTHIFDEPIEYLISNKEEEEWEK